MSSSEPVTQGSPLPVDYQTERHRAPDGTGLCVHRWRPLGDIRGYLVIVHGYAEHGARYREFAHHLAQVGWATLAPDLRGHGRSDGRRGHVQRFEEYFEDVAVALRLLPAQEPGFLLGHSNGGLIVLDYVVQKRPEVQATVVTNPYLTLATPPPRVRQVLGRAMARVYPALPISNGLNPAGLSRDSEVVEAYRRDPLVFSTVTPGWFVQAEAAQSRVRALHSFPCPLLYVYSDADPVASPPANAALAEQLQTERVEVLRLEGALHEVLNEIDRQTLYARVVDFLEQHRS